MFGLRQESDVPVKDKAKTIVHLYSTENIKHAKIGSMNLSSMILSFLFSPGVALCLLLIYSFPASALPLAASRSSTIEPSTSGLLDLQERLKTRSSPSAFQRKSLLRFDLPLAYNQKVSYWVSYFQTKGKPWFSEWLGKSTKFLPLIQKELRSSGLPQDLAYIVMIESGFEANATSKSEAVGPWQFILPTGTRYGLRVNWWLDERRDIRKSTLAASRYLADLYREFGSWYLVAASYNMGETGLRRQIEKYGTNDFWTLSQRGALPSETMNYVPKILAALMIAKAPGIYGFHGLSKMEPLEFEVVQAPGGLRLQDLADYIGVTRKYLYDLNAELVHGLVPEEIKNHLIRIPKGSMSLVTNYIAKQDQQH